MCSRRLLPPSGVNRRAWLFRTTPLRTRGELWKPGRTCTRSAMWCELEIRCWCATGIRRWNLGAWELAWELSRVIINHDVVHEGGRICFFMRKKLNMWCAGLDEPFLFLTTVACFCGACASACDSWRPFCYSDKVHCTCAPLRASVSPSFCFVRRLDSSTLIQKLSYVSRWVNYHSH